MSAITVTFPGGRRVDARVGEHLVRTDQPVAHGGGNSAPDPFSLFLASLATCAGFYVQAFCATREIAMRDIRLSQDASFDEQKRLVEVVLSVEVPPGFPERYLDGIRAAAASCKVKKVLASPPDVVVRVSRQPPTPAPPVNDAATAARQGGSSE